MGKILTNEGYILKDVEATKISKVAYSTTASNQIAVKLAGATQRLYIRDIQVFSVDADDTNNITVDFYVTTSNASVDGGADTTSPTITNWIGSAYFDAGLAGKMQKIEAEYVGALGEDLVAVVTIAAGTPTVKYVCYYELI